MDEVTTIAVAYLLTAALLGTLAAATFLRAARIKRQLQQASLRERE